MDPDTFIQTAGHGERHAVLEALRAHPDLAMSRNAEGLSVIAATVYAGRLELAQQIAQARSELDLCEAACSGDVESMGRLLDAEPEAIDRFAPDGFQAIGLAAHFGHRELLGMLIERGAEVDRPSRNRMALRPLHSAVAHPDRARALGLARLLIEAGANPDARREGGLTPLHDAVANEHLELVELLLAAGAHPHLSNDEGDSPLQLAQLRGYARIADRLDRAPIG